MRRTAALFVAAAIATIGSSCMWEDGHRSRGASDALQPSAPPPAFEDRGPLEAFDLEGCEDHATWADARGRLRREGINHADEPEHKQAGARIDVVRENRLLVAWAVGYTVEDDKAETPVSRPWASCFVPSALTEDIPAVSFGASGQDERKIVELKILDEGDRPEDGRREYATVVDLVERKVMSRVLCYLSSTNVADPPVGTACLARRECDVSPRSLELEAAPWQFPFSSGCAALFEQRSRAPERASGRFSIPRSKPSDWL